MQIFNITFKLHSTNVAHKTVFMIYSSPIAKVINQQDLKDKLEWEDSDGSAL